MMQLYGLTAYFAGRQRLQCFFPELQTIEIAMSVVQQIEKTKRQKSATVILQVYLAT